MPLHVPLLVTWVDSNYVAGWYPLVKVTAKLPTAKTLGFVTYNNEDILELSGSLGEDGAKLNPLSIPWVSIVGLTALDVDVPVAEEVETSLQVRERFEPEEHTHDLPETVESDADFNFRRMQLEDR